MSSGCSDYRAVLILYMHLMMTLKYCLSSILISDVISVGIASLSSWKRTTREVVNSLELSNLLTSFYDSLVIEFCSVAALPILLTLRDCLSSSSFSLANALSKKLSKALYTSTLRAMRTSSFWTKESLTAEISLMRSSSILI